MCSEVVHHHDLSWLKARYEHLLDVGLEDAGGGRPFYGQRRSHPLHAHARKHRRVLASTSWHRQIQALASGRVAVDRRERSMRPALVHEDEPLRLHHRGYHHPPGCPLELVALGGNSSPFLRVEPIRAMARHMVERLTESPVMASM